MRILEVIQREFVHQTVLIVTHSMQRILGFDKVAVISHGQLAEFGSPRELLSKPDSALTGLCAAQETS